MPPGLFRNSLSPKEINHGIRILGSGVLQRPFAGILNVSQSVISRMWNRHLSHTYITTGLQLNDRTIFVDLVQRQRFQNATSLNKEFRNGNGVHISTQTVRNRLHGFGLHARRPAICVPLTTLAGQVRLC